MWWHYRKYDGEYPVWAFVEVISLGTLVNFYQFCADRLDRTDMINEGYLLIKIKELRNASAHSNCIIHALGKKDATYRIGKIVYSALTPISKETKRTQLKNERTSQITTLLFSHKHFVSSKGVHSRAGHDLRELSTRMNLNLDYYANNKNITAFFSFFEKLIDIFF